MPTGSSLRDFAALARRHGGALVARELTLDSDTPVSAFLKLRQGAAGGDGFLLESLEGGERAGRYAYLGVRPRHRLEIRGEVARLYVGATRRRPLVESRGPLAAVRALLRGRSPGVPEGLPPFTGGLVGFFGFGVARWFEPGLPDRHPEETGFPDAELFAVDTVVALDRVRPRAILLTSAWPAEAGGVARAFAAAQRTLDGLERRLAGPAPRAAALRPPPPGPIQVAPSRAAFRAVVRRGREHVHAGDCMQVVLSRRFSAPFEGDPFELYRALRAVNPSPYCFHLALGPRALVGASPELLVQVERDTLVLRPIAGTRARGRSPAEDRAQERELLADPKERAEHLMLVDLARNDIGRVARPGSVAVESLLEVERYSHVMHLVSQLRGRLRSGLGPLDALAACFPAGTVSGAPKFRAMQLIDELETQRRGPYAGAVGWISHGGEATLALTLRSFFLEGGVARWQAGAGIVADSDPELETLETEHKAGALRQALGRA